MYAYATLSLDRKDNALAVPLQAVSSKEGKVTVLVVKPLGILEECVVVLGIETPTKAEIISGLKENELVVIGSRSQLKAGQTVDPKLTLMAETRGTTDAGFCDSQPLFHHRVCLMILVVGVSSVVRMPVDLFPRSIFPLWWSPPSTRGCRRSKWKRTSPDASSVSLLWRSSIEHIESRSLPGVSLIKIFFQPGTDADSAVTKISNLAMANLRRLPPGTLPPVVLKFDASSLPVGLIALKGEGLNESTLRDTAQYAVRNQVANVPGLPCRRRLEGVTGRSWSTSIR